MTHPTSSSKQAAACGVLVVGASCGEAAAKGLRGHGCVLMNIAFIVAL